MMSTPLAWRAALWALAALAVAEGAWAEQQQAKQRALRREPCAPQDLRAIAQARAAELGLELRLDQALIAFDSYGRRVTASTT